MTHSLRARGDGEQRAALARAVEHHGVADACIRGRDDDGTAVLDEPDVTDEAGVQDAVDGLDVVRCALRKAAHAGPLGLCEGAGRIHAPLIARDWHHAKVHFALSSRTIMG